MRDYSKVSPRFWTGETGREIRLLGPEAQVVAFYLFTCPSANMLGLYYLNLPALCHETGRPLEGVLKALRSLENIGFAYYDKKSEHVYLPNMAREQIGERIKDKDLRHVAVLRELESLRKTPFFNAFVEKYREAFRLQSVELNKKDEGGAKGDGRGMQDPSPPLRSQEQEQEQEHAQEQKIDIRPERSVDNPGIDLKAPNGTESLDSVSPDTPPAAAAKKCTSERREKRADVEAVFKHWQVMWGHPTSKLDRKRQARIEARLKEGFTVEQLCNAIAGFKHSPWHNGTDPNGNGTVYDGIETLLRGAEQVEKGLAFHAAPPKANGNANVAGAFAAWDRVAQHVKGAYRNGLLGDERVDKIVAYIGGYTRLAMSNTHELGTYRVRFIQAWKDGAP